MSTASVRAVLPLAIVTCTSMLAMDLKLPAVPSLQVWFDIDVTIAQATIAIFLVGLMAQRGPRSSVRIGV